MVRYSERQGSYGSVFFLAAHRNLFLRSLTAPAYQLG